MHRTGAFRRHHRDRVKNNYLDKLRSSYSYSGNETTEEWIFLRSQMFNTRTSCSCYMCGNPRKHFNEKTYPELERSWLHDYES